jgi:DNA repair exonuclease SbcCD nuclease subunit
MTSFRYLHAADIHLDSPLVGLSRYEGLPDADIRGATRAAFDNLVQRAIEEDVDFVVIAGDLFDGDWKDMGTGLYFARAMGRLHQAEIPVFLLAGNHDAASVITRSVPWPDNVRVFGSRRAETHIIEDLKVAISGQSFATSAVTDNLVLTYPDAVEHHFNIGVLHTALAGRKGHAPYAPCSTDDLRSKRYDYWALGHVHEHEIVSEDPHIVFPGNMQGRTIRETGPKGAVLVTVQDMQVTAVEHIELDVLRWVRVAVDCTNKSADDLTALISAPLGEAWHAHAAGMPLIARVALVGMTRDAGAIHDKAATLRDNARAVASAISPDLFIEKVKIEVSAPPPSTDVVIGDDLAALIDQAAGDPALATMIAEDLEPFLLAAHTSVGPPEEDELRHAAGEGDWPVVLKTAALALQSRLTGER